MTVSSRDPRVARVIAFFEHFGPEHLPRLGEVYAEDATFKDPFNDVRSLAAIERVFAHMFRTLDEPRFVVHEAVVEGDRAFLVWDFLFRLRRPRAAPLAIRGATQLRLASDGRITMHRDYWDTGEELYQKLPGLRLLMRWLRRRVAAG